MTKDQLNERLAISMARSMEAEGADYERMKKILLKGVRAHKNR